MGRETCVLCLMSRHEREPCPERTKITKREGILCANQMLLQYTRRTPKELFIYLTGVDLVPVRRDVLYDCKSTEHKNVTECIKDPHTAIFTGPTGFGKRHFVLDLIEKNTTRNVTVPSLSAERSDGTRHIIKT